MTSSDITDDDGLVYSPTPLMPEIFVDLDLLLITATDESMRQSALIAGTKEVLSRFEHLADQRVFCASSRSVISEVASAIQRLNGLGANNLAHWLTGEVLDVLTAHQQLHESCINLLRRAHEAQMMEAILDVAHSLRVAAHHVGTRRFSPFPSYPGEVWNFDVKLAVLAAMSAELRRNPLRIQLGGAGGAAGSAEFNPYVRAMYDLELVTHRRVYRVLYRLSEHVGVELSDDELFQSPEAIERKPL